jgi:hypothetical protein
MKDPWRHTSPLTANVAFSNQLAVMNSMAVKGYEENPGRLASSFHGGIPMKTYGAAVMVAPPLR